MLTSPSMSPEISHHVELKAVVCQGPTLDIFLLKDLFNSVIETSRLFNIDLSFREEVQQALNQLPPLQIGQLGQLKEWFEDWDLTADIHNRHVSVSFLFLLNNLFFFKVSFILCFSWKFRDNENNNIS